MDKYLRFIYKDNDSIILCIKLVPNSSFNKIVDYTDDFIRIKIASPPIDNRANTELIVFLSKLFDINKSKIRIVSGEKSKLKKVQILDKNFEDLSQKLLFVLDSVNR